MPHRSSSICLFLFLTLSSYTPADERPNIVVIVSDDMGYADLRRFGDSEVSTPHLDRLCDEGVRFTDAYVTAPVCVPSRMGILTGRYQQRYGIYDNMYEPEEVWLFEQEVILAEVLRQGGYRTALVGKWHLGGNGWPLSSKHAQDSGFDEFVGLSGGMTNFVKGTTLYRGQDSFPSPEYVTDFLGTEACAFIDRNRARPFFLYLGFNAVHAPLEARDEDMAALEAGGKTYDSRDRLVYAAMLRAMDRSIGRVLKTLDEHELSKKTLVVFINDNGGAGNHTPEHSRNTARNVPLRGYKFDVFEGGVRVPMVLRFPGRVSPGQVYGGLASSLDLFPTIVAAAGLTLPAGRDYDGVDLLPHVNGVKTGAPHDTLFWKNRVWDGPPNRQRARTGIHNAALRRGKWKMVKLNESIEATTPSPWLLFDLERDIGEQHDLAFEYPEVVKELDAVYRDWLSRMRPSLECRD